MNKASTIKILVASCMGITLIALLAIALFSDIPVSLQVFAVCVSIYGFLNYANGLKNKFQLVILENRYSDGGICYEKICQDTFPYNDCFGIIGVSK